MCMCRTTILEAEQYAGSKYEVQQQYSLYPSNCAQLTCGENQASTAINVLYFLGSGRDDPGPYAISSE